MRRRKVREQPDNEVAERTVIRREPVPMARAILWKPLPDSYHLLASMMRAPEQQTHLFITQRTFLQVERHLGSALELDVGGFLAGHLYQCPRTRVRYSIVNTTVPFVDVTGDPIGRRVTEREHNAVRTRLDAHGLALIGWYRNGAGLGLQLLPDDIETHLAYFSKPWQTTMLVLPDPSRPKGAFFTYDARAGRSYCVPFYELFDTGGMDGDRMARTCVTWKSYVPAVPVQSMPAEDREIAETTFKPIRNGPDPTPPDPMDEWWDAIKDPWVRIKDAAVSAAQREDEPEAIAWRPPAGSPAASAPLELPVSAPVRETRTHEEPRVREPARPLAVPATAAKAASRPAPPFVGPTRPAAQSSPPRPAVRAVDPPPPPSGSAERLSGVIETVRTPTRRTPPPRRPIPAAKAAAMAKASSSLLLTVPPELDELGMRWQKRRRIGLAVAAVSFLGVIVLSTIRARTQRVAQAATSAAVDRATPNGEAATVAAASAEREPPPLPFDSAMDSLSRAIAHYRGVENDHRRGVVGCRALDRAHALVVRARSQVEASRGRLTGALDVADSLRVSMVRAEYLHAAQLHRRSGCDA